MLTPTPPHLYRQLFRCFIISAYFYTFSFNFLFRTVYIRFSERGLVMNGRPNLSFSNYIYWVCFFAFWFLGFLLFPVVKFVNGTYSETFTGKICLRQELTATNTTIKNFIISVVADRVRKLKLSVRDIIKLGA